MFKGSMVTDAIPPRIYALYKLVPDSGISRAALRDYMEPKQLRYDENGKEKTSYFNNVFNCASELKLIRETDGIVYPAVARSNIKDMKDFKLHAILQLKDYRDSQFYKVSNELVNLNEKIFQMGGLSDLQICDYLSSKVGENIKNTNMNAWRFWSEFLGLGYISTFGTTSSIFIPNGYRFVKNILKAMELEKKKIYPIQDFLNSFNVYGSVLTDNNNGRNINMAFSNALRQLHDNREIELIYNNDRTIAYSLYPSLKSFTNPLTDIVYLGVKL